jgi:hypothetical protein
MKRLFDYAGCAIGFALSLSQIASAATKTAQPTLNELVTKVKSACQPDINKFCSDVTPGGGRIADCLSAREDKLSTDCRTARADAESNISQRLQKAEVSFRNACGSDVQRLCANVRAGEGRILNCLNQNKDHVSTGCKDFQAKLEQKLGQFLG